MDGLPDARRWPALYVWLHRRCAGQLGEVKELLRRDPRGVDDEAVRFEQLLGGPDGLSALGEALRRETGETLLPRVGALMALDSFALTRGLVHGPGLEVFTPGGVALLLPPEERPFGAWLAGEARALESREDDLRPSVRSRLDLKLRVVEVGGGPRPELLTLPAVVSHRLRARLPDLRLVALSPFEDLEYTFCGAPERKGRRGTPFTVSGLDEGAPETALRATLEACAAERPDLLLLPELSLPPALLDVLKAWLREHNTEHRPALVVAGSFHVQDEQGRPVNRCEVLDGRGRTLWVQDKFQDHRVTPEECAGVPAAKLAALGLDTDGGHEDIFLSETLRVVHSPLGRLAVTICLDFIGDPLREPLIGLGVNLLLVPASTPRTERFRQRARDLGTLNEAVSLVINSGWRLRREPGAERRQEDLFYVYLPGRGADLRAPWRPGLERVMFTIRQVLYPEP